MIADQLDCTPLRSELCKQGQGLPCCCRPEEACFCCKKIQSQFFRLVNGDKVCPAAGHDCAGRAPPCAPCSGCCRADVHGRRECTFTAARTCAEKDDTKKQDGQGQAKMYGQPTREQWAGGRASRRWMGNSVAHPPALRPEALRGLHRRLCLAHRRPLGVVPPRLLQGIDRPAPGVSRPHPPLCCSRLHPRRLVGRRRLGRLCSCLVPGSHAGKGDCGSRPRIRSCCSWAGHRRCDACICWWQGYGR